MLPILEPMGSTTLLDDLRARELVADMTNADELARHLAESPRTLYCGFDPTADSLHIGSLLPLLTLRRFQLAGHRPIVLVGGGTGLIGDPSGKTTERSLNPAQQVAEWADRLKRQVVGFLDFEGPAAARVFDNHAWLSRLDVIAFLREVGKEFAVGAMLAKEAVRSRLGRAEIGLSYTEFSYQVLQAYDFMELCRGHDCTLQIGGSDQWGNITAGIDLIRRKLGRVVHGLTLPLVTKADGSKFGKTETGTIWLDPAKTSAYEMYQFWLNTADADVVRFLNYFTFLGTDEVAQLGDEVRRQPEKRAAQRALAREVTTSVHGRAALLEAERISEALFTGDVGSLTAGEVAQILRALPPVELPAGAVTTPVDVLLATGLASSKRAGRELVGTGAVRVNGRQVKDPNAPIDRETALSGKYLIVQKGRRTYATAVWPDRR